MWWGGVWLVGGGGGGGAGARCGVGACCGGRAAPPARSTLRRLMAQGQRLYKLLARPELASLRERMEALTANPLKPAAGAAESVQAAHAQHEQDRFGICQRGVCGKQGGGTPPLCCQLFFGPPAYLSLAPWP